MTLSRYRMTAATAVRLVGMAAAAAVVARFQLWLPLVSADRLVFAAPLAVGGLFAVLAGGRAAAAVLVGTLLAGWSAGLSAGELVVTAGVVGLQGVMAVAVRRFAPPLGVARSRGVGMGVGLILLSAVVRGLATAGLWAVAGRPDPLAAGIAAAAGEWYIGVVLVATLYVWLRPPALSRVSRHFELASLLFLTALVSQVLFGGANPRPIALSVPVVGGFAALFGWAALRFHVHGSSAVAAVSFAVGAVNAAVRGTFDPAFPHAEPLAHQAQLLAVVGGLVALQHVVAAVAGDRKVLHDELKRRNAELEAQAHAAAQEHAFLEAVLSQLPVGVMIVGPDGRILQRNERHKQMFLTETAGRLDDLPQGRMSTTTVRRVPYDRWPIVRAIRTGEVTEGYSARVTVATGAEVDVQISAGPVRGPDGRLLGAVSVMADVTERNKVVRQLRESEQKLRIALQSARMTVVEWATADGAIRAPQSLAEWFRLSPDASLTAVPDLLPFVHPDDANGLAEKVRGLMAGGPRCETLFRVRDRHGQVTWALSRSQALTDEAGTPTGWVSSVLVDVTERYRQLDELRLLESAVVHARDAVVILEDKPQGGGGRSVLYANRAFALMSGYEPHEVVGRSLHFLRGPNSCPATLDQLRDALDARRPFQCEVLNYRKDGTEYWVELSVVPVPDPSGACSHWVMIQRDVSDRKRADAELRQSREMLAEAQRIAHVGSWEHFPGAARSAWSDEEYRIFGVDPATFAPTADAFLALVHPDDRPRVAAELGEAITRGGDHLAADFRIVRPDGEVRYVHEECVPERDADGRVVRVRGVTQDVTERKQAQEQLIQAQKMELIGQMAGGIAHDFNNVLTGVIGNLDLVALPAGDPNRRLIETATKAAFRATDMTKKLLGFARKSQLRIAPVSVAGVVAEVLEFVGRTTDPRIELRPFVRTAAKVDGDFTLLSQVLLNLCLNSRAAMPHGGRIEIRADEVDHPPAAPHPSGRAGRFVRLTVEDTGVGMTPEVLARVFEPFFTTKPVGEGTGLGLPMVHGIVEQHRGWVECASEVGRGTRFDLFLPRSAAADDPPASADRPPLALTPPPAAARGRKTVLLVDDEEMIRELARTVLQVNGYTVLEACDGEEAIDLFHERAADIDLVILDLTMPRMSGQDTFRAMTAIDPDARILFSSGYSAETLADTDGVLGLLPKPYRPADLLAAVDRALSATPALATVS